jgi:hypothetical protein
MSADTVKERLAALHCEADFCKFDGKAHAPRIRASGLSAIASRPRSSPATRSRQRPNGVVTRKQDIGDIGYAMGRYEDLPVIGTRLMTGGEICRWKVGKDLTLVLKVDTVGEPMSYLLTLARS